MSDRERSVIEWVLSLLDYRLEHPACGGLREAGEALQMSREDVLAASEFIEFMEEMPGGFLIYRANGGEEILYANKGLLRIFQCETMEDFRVQTGNSFRGLVMEEDL